MNRHRYPLRSCRRPRTGPKDHGRKNPGSKKDKFRPRFTKRTMQHQRLVRGGGCTRDLLVFTSADVRQLKRLRAENRTLRAEVKDLKAWKAEMTKRVRASNARSRQLFPSFLDDRDRVLDQAATGEP